MNFKTSGEKRQNFSLRKLAVGLVSVKVVNVILAPFKRRDINVFSLFYRKCSHKCSHFAKPSILQFL